MKRLTTLLVVLGLVLTLVAWYFLLWQPGSDELADVELQIEQVQASQSTTRARMGELQSVRERAPQLQAEVTAGETILPEGSSLPSALRQLQQAADESGATLMSVAPGRPASVEGADPTLYSMSLSFDLQGSFFQIVDTLRRLEDPRISPRGFLWRSLSLSTEELPTLVASITAEMFTVLPAPPVDAAAGGEPVAEAGPDGDAEAPADDVPIDGAGTSAEAGTTDIATTEGGVQ